jgi:hypothetical protein
LVGEAATVEAMNALLSKRVPELLGLNRPDLIASGQCDVPIELLATQKQTIRIAC